MPIINVGKFHYQVPLKSFISDRSIIKEQKIIENTEFIATSIEESIEKFSALIRNEAKEHMCIFKPDGNLLYKIDGSKYSVITPNEIDTNMTGNITLHNHPLVQSFSPTDIKSTCQYNAKKIFVVDKEKRYSMERKSGENFNLGVWAQIESIFEKAKKEVSPKLLYNDLSTQREFYEHLIWKEICSDSGNDLIYTVEKLQNNGEYIKDYRTPK